MSHPLRLRAFPLLFLGRTLSALGDAVAPAALAIAVSQTTGSSGALAIVLGSATVPRLLLLPVGGVVSDRIGPRRVALAAYLVNCCAQLAIALQPEQNRAHSPRTRAARTLTTVWRGAGSGRGQSGDTRKP